MRADRATERFSRYLNGPMGKTVLENLEEGESFMLQTSERVFRVAKFNGRAIVDGHPPSLRYLPVEAKLWSYIHHALDAYKAEGIRVHHDLLHALGFGYLGFIDADIPKILKLVGEETSIDSGKEEVLPLLVEQMIMQIKTKGPTTGLNLDEAMKKHADFVVLVPEILKRRKTEIEEVCVLKMNNLYGLRYLWLTAYGFEILKALKMNLHTNQDGLHQIQEALDKLGYELKITNAQRAASPVRMSRKLMGCIWEVASHVPPSAK